MTPEDLGRYHTPSDPQIHPEGDRVAFVVSTMNLDEDRYDRQIWLADGAGARPFTAGPGDTYPRWSPDGSRLAFLRSAGSKDPAQLLVMPTGGGEAVRLTDLDLGATELAWSPDGSTIAVVGKVWTEEWAGLDDDERARQPRRITRAYWRADNRGWIHDRRSHVFLVDASGGGEPTLLTAGEFDETGVGWHPGGDHLVFLSARHPERGLQPGTQAWVIPASGGDPEPRTDVGLWAWCGFSPAGDLHVIGRPDRWDMPSVNVLYRVEGDGSLTSRTEALDRNPLPFAPAISPPGAQWVGDGFVCTLEDDAAVRVIRVAADDTVTEVVGGRRVVTGVTTTADGAAAAFVATTPTDPGEVYLVDTGGERAITDLNAAFRDEVPLSEPIALAYDSDGTEIRGWVFLPPGSDENRSVPLLLNIHGGPATQYGEGFFDEFQVYAGAGYGVVAVNPRGSSGRGLDFVRAVVGRWQDDDLPDMADFQGAVTAALEQVPQLDPDRLGVMGGSYGGFATIRLLADDQRFRSAVAERSLSTFMSFAGTSDIGPWFDKMYLNAEPPAGWDEYWRASPLSHAHQIETPTLVVHSEADYRTPIEQGEQLFVLLLRMGTPAEMIRFPAESHELSRSGKPRHRHERFEAILDWHARHLLPDPS